MRLRLEGQEGKTLLFFKLSYLPSFFKSRFFYCSHNGLVRLLYVMIRIAVVFIIAGALCSSSLPVCGMCYVCRVVLRCRFGYWR